MSNSFAASCYLLLYARPCVWELWHYTWQAGHLGFVQQAATRSASTSYKWSYNPYKWTYKRVTGVTTLLLTGNGISSTIAGKCSKHKAAGERVLQCKNSPCKITIQELKENVQFGGGCSKEPFRCFPFPKKQVWPPSQTSPCSCFQSDLKYILECIKNQGKRLTINKCPCKRSALFEFWLWRWLLPKCTAKRSKVGIPWFGRVWPSAPQTRMRSDLRMANLSTGQAWHV